eukprot:GILK01004675.1.p1 GENE.GILK01004675.1~~GILK01004675.1.p1  ORF type:complete len:120 (+),score=9.99 GILK01004675.1:37-360(+)
MTDSNSSEACYVVEGFEGCSWFRRAACAALELQKQQPSVKVVIRSMSKPSFVESLKARNAEFSTIHNSCPLVYEASSDRAYIGGFDRFVHLIEKRHAHMTPYFCFQA